MIHPSIDDLVEHFDSKYTLVIATAKRARQLRNGSRKTIKKDYQKDVATALHEIAAGNIKYERYRDGIK